MARSRDGGGDELVTRMLSKQRPRDALEEQQALANIEHQLLGRKPVLVQLSRYVLLERLGQGGAGIVYAAYDPELDRKVAIKLLRDDVGDGSSGSDGHVRLLREAQAMARLAHPNVIAVYDVGTYADEDLKPARPGVVSDDDAGLLRGVFVVMELVEGESLSQWMREGTRGWREVLSVFVPAGRGLAAAHATGLVHRDFKPGNVLVGNDGRTRVLDFGLARSHGEPSGTNLDAQVERGLKQSGAIALHLDSPLTQTGTVMGTPPYMAPEQHRGEPADAAADQFSFCVALYEALYGKRPYRSDNMDDLRRQKESGDPPVPPEDTGVPVWVQRIVARGLSADPGARYQHMSELLSELDDDPAARRVRVAVAAAAVALVAGLGAGVWSWAKERSQLCQGQDIKLAGVWDDDVRQAVHASFTNSGKPYAETAWTSTEKMLDEYARDWVTIRTDACREATVERDLPIAEMERRNECLDRRLGSMAELTRQFRLDSDLVENSFEVTAALPSLTPCRAAPRRQGQAEADVEARKRIAEIDTEIARASTLMSLVKYPDAREVLDAALERAQRIGDRGAEARALWTLGRLDDLGGEFKSAEDRLYAALAAAEEVGDVETGTRALVHLIWVVGVSGARHKEAQRLVQQARARIDRRGVDDTLTAEFHTMHGSLLHAMGEYAKALEPHGAALEIFERVAGPQSHRVALQLNSIGLEHYRLGQNDEARAHMTRALEIWKTRLGLEHPQVANVLNNLGITEMAAGDAEKALEYQLQPLDIRLASIGANHPLLVVTYSNIGNAYHAMGKIEQALEYQTKAVETAARAYGDDHPSYAMALGNEGTALMELGRLEESEQNHRKALTIYDTRYEPGHPMSGYPLVNLADALLAQGKPKAARPYAVKALEVWEKAFGRDHQNVAAALTGLARIDFALGETGKANDAFREAHAVLQRGGDKTITAQATFGLARTLPRAERARAIELANSARAMFSELDREADVAEIDAWLANDGG